jgi:chromosome segregation ATPase
VGSLLTDLLSEAQREADEERANLRDQISARNAEETAQKESSEAAKREEMQRRLIEETRKRNEVLTRKQRAEATAQAIKDAKPMLASADSVCDFEGQARNASASKTWMIVGVVALLGVAVLAFMYVGTAGKLDEANKSNATQKADNDKLTKEAGELASKVSTLETSLTATKGELSQATSDRKTAEEAKAKLDVSMTDTNAKLKTANEEIQKLKEAAEQAGSVKSRPGKRTVPRRRGGLKLRKTF